MNTCPNCGYRHDERGYAGELYRLRLTGLERRIVARLARANGGFVQREQIIHELYGDRIDGPPDSIDKSLKEIICRLKRKIANHWWTVESERFAGYRLVRTMKRPVRVPAASAIMEAAI